MKHIKIFLCILFSTTAGAVFSQALESPFIEVRGMAKIERAIKSYTINVVISEDLGYSEEKRSFDDVKNTFFDQAKAAGLDITKFKEDKLTYALTQYGVGSLYSFETANTEDVILLNKLVVDKTGTVSIFSRSVTYLPIKDFGKIIAAAFSDGKERAELIAATMGKQLGTLLTTVDYSTLNVVEEDTLYYQTKENNYYYLSLKYEVK
ncbi:hypothetical protein [Sphingobacterium deserti]|uniref:DUF541 domain-containing protein n=1 Tax=Sphingobacterium deserti TaxID=1229276 RepID=A0A0B8T1G9_9SPHI|nr:hypothetical protein [Sphingobacterium deserti]KGE12523.1 hypothetical protein DI53_3563 [Sphingobacterium deserti]